ncbi:hypothetical protein FB451DRAFT_1168234 [Mycena latifolia]|nr:hypothetical protein FB451DRAFT_1168234 [Mycena latifolia]
MSTAQRIQVRLAVNATDAEITKATTVLGEAFSWCTRPTFILARSIDILEDFFNDGLDGDASLVPEAIGAYLKGGLVGGLVYFAENESAEIVGVAIWFPPGTTALGTPEQRAAGWDQLTAKLSEKCRSWWPDFLGYLYDDFVENTLGPGVMLGAYHLQVLGIHPDYQRQGIARKMLEIVEEQARANNAICVLETVLEQWAKVVYKALGYEIKGLSDMINNPDGKPYTKFYLMISFYGYFPLAIETLIMVLPFYLGPASDAEAFYKPLLDLKPPMSDLENVTYNRKNDSANPFCGKGGFNRLAGAGAPAFKPKI